MIAESRKSLPLGIFELDADGRVLAFSTYKTNVQGKVRQDLVGKNFFTEFAGMSANKLEGCFHRVYRDRIPFNKSYVEGGALERRAVLMMFFPDTHSVMVKVDQQ